MQERDSKKTWLPEGTVFEDRWVLGRPLGRGGFASVYEARHIKLESRAAVKILDIQSQHPDEQEVFHKRFLREAKLSAQLEHPNVVKILDFGIYPRNGNETPFIVMEFLEGHDLEHELLENGPLSSTRAARLFDGALDALRASHAHGVVHRDLKPSNLYLVHPGQDNERLVVVDFGIARAFDDADGKLTATNHFTGTPAYLSPEYISDQIVSPAIDIYQMGLIIAESLTGQPVVQASAPLGYLVAHCNGKQELPAYLERTKLGAELRRAVNVDPGARHDSIDTLRTSLANVDWSEVGEVDPTLDATLPDMTFPIAPSLELEAGVVPASANTPDKLTSPLKPPARIEPSTREDSKGVPLRVVAAGMLLMGGLAALGGVWFMSSEQAPPRAVDPPALASSDSAKAPSVPMNTASGEITKIDARPATTAPVDDLSAADVVGETAPLAPPADKTTPAIAAPKGSGRVAPASATGKGRKAKASGASKRVVVKEPVEMLKPAPIDKKLGLAYDYYKTIAGGVSQERHAYLSRVEKDTLDEPRQVSLSFSDVARGHRQAASALEKSAKSAPSSGTYDARARALARSLREVAAIAQEGYDYRMGDEHPKEKLVDIDRRYAVAYAAFEKDRDKFLESLYGLEVATLRARFEATDARTGPIMHHLHGYLYHATLAMQAVEGDDTTLKAAPHVKRALSHAKRYKSHKLHEELSALPSSVRNRIHDVMRSANHLPKKLEDIRAAVSRAKMQTPAKGKQTIASKWFYCYMGRQIPMGRYYEREF